LARSRSTKSISYEERSFGEGVRQILDSQALLIMYALNRDVRRFQDIQKLTAMSTALLTSRLRRLKRDGIVSRRRYCHHPPRFEYLATPKGKGLDQVLLAASDWHSNWNDSPDVPSSPLANTLIEKPRAVFPTLGPYTLPSPASEQSFRE
jgi:DNA-binding HxlR family transcriptional regulator